MPSRQKRAAEEPERRPHNMRLPMFVADEPVGLGDVLKHATSTIGIRPCGGCAKRGGARTVWSRLQEEAASADKCEETT